MALTPLTIHFDKKCGASGIPDNAKCTKSAVGAPLGSTPPATQAKKPSPNKKGPNLLGMVGAGLQLYGHGSTAAELIDYYNKSGRDETYALAAAGQIGAGVLAGLGFAENARGNSGRGSLYSLGAYGTGVATNLGASAYAQAKQRRTEQQKQTGYKGSDPFKDLGVKEGASASELRKAFLKRAKQAHPDMGGTAEEMAKINAAYQEALRRSGVARSPSRTGSRRSSRTQPSTTRRGFPALGRGDSVWAYGFEP